MAWFTAKEWKNRLVEFAGRRSLKNVSTNETTVYDVTRNEGQVSQEGDSFSATTMNDLEQRISDAFAEAEEANTQLSSEMANKVAVGGNTRFHGIFIGEDGTDAYIYGDDALSSDNQNIYFRYISNGEILYTNISWLRSSIDNLKVSFQDGCNTLVNKCASLGVTPNSNSPTDISNAIDNIANNKYNAGFNAGKATVVDLGIISASSQSGSNTRDSTFNLTKYSGYKNIGSGNIVFMPVSWTNNGGVGKDMDNFQGPAIKSYNASTGIVTLMGASGTGYGWGASIASARFVIIT